MKDTATANELQTAARLIRRNLQRMPIGRSMVEIAAASQNAAHDINIYIAGMWVGVVEVEGHRIGLIERMEIGHIEVTTERLKKLKDSFYRKTWGGWAKDVCLGWVTADNALLLMNISEIVHHWKELEDTDDGKLVPMDQMIALDSTSSGDD